MHQEEEHPFALSDARRKVDRRVSGVKGIINRWFEEMTMERPTSEFPEHSDENLRIWDANARWWDDRISDGNAFQTLLIEPSTQRLLAVTSEDVIVDIACGAGRFARRLAELGATVVAFDYSSKFIERARERTPKSASIEYHVLDAGKAEALLSLGVGRFDKAVCTMALMDMPEINPLLSALKQLLKPGGLFVFSVTHPCFHSAGIQRFAEMYEEEAGRHIVRTGVKVSSYVFPFVKSRKVLSDNHNPSITFTGRFMCCFNPVLTPGSSWMGSRSRHSPSRIS